MVETTPKCGGLVLQLGKIMSASIHKMAFPYFPMNPAFTHLSPETLSSTSGSISKSLPLNVILERVKAAKQCLEEENKASTSLKCCVKQGLIKKSKKQRDE